MTIRFKVSAMGIGSWLVSDNERLDYELFDSWVEAMADVNQTIARDDFARILDSHQTRRRPGRRVAWPWREAVDGSIPWPFARSLASH